MPRPRHSGLRLRASVVVSLVLVLGACGGQPSAPATVEPPSRLASAVAGQAGNPAMGRQLFQAKGCIACHVTSAVPGGGNVGPNLDGFARRPRIAETLDNTPDNLRRFLRNPPAIKRGTLMPNVNLSAQEADNLSAFLYSLP